MALCLYSSLFDKPINESTIAFGEIGLGGEVRAVSNIVQRIKEAERMGFEQCLIPAQSFNSLNSREYGIKLIGVSDVKEAFRIFK